MRAPQLSARERQIVTCRAHGLTCKEIADQLGIALGTVKTHLTRAFAKLGARNSLELVLRLEGDHCVQCRFAAIQGLPARPRPSRLVTTPLIK